MSKLDPFSAFLKLHRLGEMQNMDDDPPSMGGVAHRIKKLEEELQAYISTGTSTGEGNKDGKNDNGLSG